MSSAPLPPSRRQAYSADHATSPRPPPLHLAEDKSASMPFPPGPALESAGSSATGSSGAVGVDVLSATEMESHLAAFDTLGPPGASRRPTRRVRSIDRTWTWVKSRSSVYGEASLLDVDNLLANGERHDADTEGVSSRPATVAETGNVDLAQSPPRRNSTTVLDPDERRRRRQAIVPDSVSVNGLRPPPRHRPVSRSFTSPIPIISMDAGVSDDSYNSLSRSTTSGRHHRERPRPLPIFPPGPESDSPPTSAHSTPMGTNGGVSDPHPLPPLPTRARPATIHQPAKAAPPATTSQQPPTAPTPEPAAAPRPRPLAATSIHDIVNRHSSAVAQATEDVKDRARAELALRPDLLASVRTRKKSLPVSRDKTPPPPPPKLELEPAVGSTSAPPPLPGPPPPPPGAAPPAPPPPVKYTHKRRPSSRSTTVSTDTSDSYVNEIRLAQAAYNHLTPKPSTPAPLSTGPAPAPTLTPPPAGNATPHNRMIFSPTPEHSPGAKHSRDRDRMHTQSPDDGSNRSNASLNASISRSKSTSPFPPEDDSHAIALYLRSPQLNRNLLIARPYPERPLQVSVADLGKPDGRPVVVFLGLGCVRYLIALYDDLARALGLRLICIDRWGLGKTDQIPQNQRGLLDWAEVVRRVLDELGIERFQVLAHSAGAPYALATVLKMERRVHGKIHLLAPWVGGDVDGYRWLKWVPNSVIKSALAAEWRLESYFLGKAPTIKNTIRGKSEAMMSSSSLDSDGGRSPASFNQDQAPPRPDSRLGAVEVDGFDTLASDLYPAPSGWTTTPPSVSVSSVSSSPGFTQALMQASHAESLSGTTADLLSVVLGRDAKPWGFSYTDIRHPCKIWYGAEDERVSEKSMRWMERAMDAELLVVPGEGHNLMSSRVVMFDVLDSLAEDI